MTDKYQQGIDNELTRKRGAANLLGRQEEGSAKKPYSLPGKEPDVIVLVGDTEFYEHSKDLRAWSDYFDTALDSGMKETCQGRFEFPHRSPTEWQCIKELAAPFATKKIDRGNVRFAASWFDELCCDSGMKSCDQFIVSELLEYHFSRDENIPHDCDEKVEILYLLWDEFCTHYHLPLTKAKLLHYFGNMLTHAPFLFSSRYLWRRMIGLVQVEDGMECQRKLWQAFKKNLPASVLNLDTEGALLENELLPEVLILNHEIRAIEAEYLRICALFKKPPDVPPKIEWKSWITSMATSQLELDQDSQWEKLYKYLPVIIDDMSRDELLSNCLLNDLLSLGSTKMQYSEKADSFWYEGIDNRGEWGRFLISIQDNTYDGCVHRSSSPCPACRPALRPESQN